MGKDVQVLKLEIQNHTVTVLYRTDRGPTLPPLYYIIKYTTTNPLDKGPVVRSFTVFFVHHTKKPNLVQNKKFCGFQTQGCNIHLYIISLWLFNQQT